MCVWSIHGDSYINTLVLCLVAAVPAKRSAEESGDFEKKRQRYEEASVQRDKERLAAKLDGAKTTSSSKPTAEGTE